jgi:hypothetical protein
MRESTVLTRRFRDSPQQGDGRSIFFPQVFAEVVVPAGGGAAETSRPRVESVHQEVPVKIRRIAGVVAGVTAIAAVPAGLAVAGSSGLKVTGGGQVLFDDQASGPGDTIAFTAQQDGPFDADMVAPAKGQIQVVNRTAGTGQSQTKFHGTVTCIFTFTYDNETPADTTDDETYVRFGGRKTVKGKPTTIPFTTDVQDNGEGAAATESDVIFFRERGEGDDPCDESDPATSLRNFRLARGNVQQHKQSSNSSSTKGRPASAKSTTTSTRLSVLR